jgi:hypothetical protein
MIQFYGSRDGMLAYGKKCMESAAKAGNVMEMYVAENQSHGFFNDSPWRECTIWKADEFLAKYGYVKGKPTAEVKQGTQLIPYVNKKNKRSVITR